MNNYIISFTKKFDYFFEQKEISNIIYLHDEETMSFSLRKIMVML